EKVETVRGSLIEARDNVVPGWSRTNFSTGLPQRMNLGISGNFIRAIVTATTGESGVSNSWFSSGISNPLIFPHCLIKVNRVCHPFAIILPRLFFSKKRSTAVSFSHWANTATCLTSIRDGEKIADPNVMQVIHSA